MADADAGALYTTKQASTLGEGHYIVIDNRACEVHNVSEFVNKERGRKRGPPMLRFIAHDIFTRNEFVHTCLPSDLLQVPVVNNTDYKIVDISRDGSVTLVVTETDEIKVFNVTDVDILNKVRAGLLERKKLFATVMSAMGEEQVCGFKVINPI